MTKDHTVQYSSNYMSTTFSDLIYSIKVNVLMQNPLPYEKEETLEEATSINMDRLTQLQDAIDEMARVFANSVEFLNKVQVDHDQAKLKENKQEIVQDIVKKAKQIELLIDKLPGIRNTEQEQIDMIKELNKEMHEANLEYLKAVENAESLRKQVMETIGMLCKDQSTAYNSENSENSEKEL